MKYLITGVNGFVGKYFIEYLEKIEPEASIFGVDILKEFDCKNNIAYKQIDLSNRLAVYELLNNIRPNYIVHLAAMSSVQQSWQDPAKSFLNNTTVFLNLADAVRELDINCRILSVGSSEEYGIYSEKIEENFVLHPKSPYSVARLSQEYLSKLYVDNFGMDIVMTRSFNHIGPRQNPRFVVPSFIEQLIKFKNKEQDKILVGNLDVTRDFLDVRDVVVAYYKIIKNSKNRMVYNVCSGEGVKLRKIIDLVSEKLKVTPNIIIDENKLRPNEILSVVGDNSKLKKELNWTQKYTLKDTLNEMVTYYLEKNENIG